MATLERPLWVISGHTDKSAHVRFTPNNGPWALSVYEYTTPEDTSTRPPPDGSRDEIVHLSSPAERAGP
jgi:hypothetical protein